MDYLEVVLEADRRLREKFGSLVTDWHPTAENCIFLSEADYDAKFNLPEDKSDALWHVAAVHEATRTISFRLSEDVTREELLASATHEMLHLHQGGLLVPFLFGHKKDFDGLSDDELHNVRLITTEVVIELLVPRVLGKIGLLEAATKKWSVTGTYIRIGLHRMVDILGEDYNQELYMLLRGIVTPKVVSRFEEVFGEDSFEEFFLNLIDLQARIDYFSEEDEESKENEELSNALLKSFLEQVEAGAQVVGKPELGADAMMKEIIELLGFAYRKAKPEDQQSIRELLLSGR